MKKVSRLGFFIYPAVMTFTGSVAIFGIGAGFFAAAAPGLGNSEPTGIRIDSEAAVDTVDAVLNPALTRQQALAVADLPANQGLIEQAREFGTGDTRESFADKLLAEAQGHGGQSAFNFDEVRREATAVRSAIKGLQSDPTGTTEWIRDRLAAFASPGIR